MGKQTGIALLFAGGLTLTACGGAPTDGQLVADPYEDINRGVHSVNKGLDQAVLRPAAQGYDLITPTLFQHMIGNVFAHLSLPGEFLNHLMQGDGDDALVTLGRFAMNTIVGAGGTLDPATEFSMERQKTDFGLTMASWGVEEGAYIELPLFGPSTARDAVGTLVDMAVQPTTYVTGGVEVTIASATASALEIVDNRNRNAALIDDLLYNSEDSYLSVRTGYIQNRRRQVAGGETDVDALPDLFSE